MGVGGWDGRGMLVREVDVHKGCDGLDRARLLSVFNEIALTGLVLRVPLEAVAFWSANTDINWAE